MPSLLVDWRVHQGGQQIAHREQAPFLEAGYGHVSDQLLVKLGWFYAYGPGAYEVRLDLKRVPQALRGERAHLLVDSDEVAYKTARGKASVRNVVHVLLGCSATVTLLLGLLAVQLRPRSPVAGDQELQERT